MSQPHSTNPLTFGDAACLALLEALPDRPLRVATRAGTHRTPTVSPDDSHTVLLVITRSYVAVSAWGARTAAGTLRLVPELSRQVPYPADLAAPAAADRYTEQLQTVVVDVLAALNDQGATGGG